jgi:hypothetical protein
LAERQSKLEPKLIIQSIDFKYATPNRKNRLLLFNGHSIPIFVEHLWLMREDVKYWGGPTFTLNEVIPPNSIKEIVSPPFRDDDTAGESWEFPKDDYRAGVIQSFDTNWTHVKPGWESERWESGEPVYMKATISYRAGDQRLLTSTPVWQGFSFAIGTHWR